MFWLLFCIIVHTNVDKFYRNWESNVNPNVNELCKCRPHIYNMSLIWKYIFSLSITWHGAWARKLYFPKIPSYNCTSDIWFTLNIEWVLTAHSGVFYALVNNVGSAKYSQIFLSISFPLSSEEQSHIITARHFLLYFL